MQTFQEVVEDRIIEVKNINVDTTDVDFLKQFKVNIKSLAHTDIFDLMTIFYMVKEQISYKEAIEEINKCRDILEEQLITEGLEYVLHLMDMMYTFMEKCDGKYNDISVKSILRTKSCSKISILVKTFLKLLNNKYSEEEINAFLKWLCYDNLSDILALALNLKGVEQQLDSVYDELNDLNLPDFFSNKLTRRLQEGFVNDVNSSYLKEMNHEFNKELDELNSYKNKKVIEVNSALKKIRRELRDLDELLSSYSRNSLTIEMIEKSKTTPYVKNRAMIELIKSCNIGFQANYDTVIKYRKNPINKMELIFSECGRNFNKLTEAEQQLLANGYETSLIKENLTFMTTGTLRFIEETDEVFVPMLIKDIEILMQIDSLLIRGKISQDFILRYGNKLDALAVKKLVRIVTKLDSEKVNLQELEKYNTDMFFDLDLKLFDMIVNYGINLNDENLKHFEFLENAKLLNVIDQYIELGLIKQIQASPNLIISDSDCILKRIVLMQQLEQNYLTEKNTLNQMVRSGKDFYLGDDHLDDYVYQNFSIHMNSDIKEILDKNPNVEMICELPEEISFIEEYKKNEHVYMIGGFYFSRLKVLRCLNTLIKYGFDDYKELLFQSLIYNYPKHLSIEVTEALKTIDGDNLRKQLNN